ncbi:methyl farnesoate epoxidase-like [Hetaerina americana]|uniref:methyl farnesoate epoxidase-like n=1 Tax=Hetaerina americana TaxID=62018 RepID=UPI003A7F2129
MKQGPINWPIFGSISIIASRRTSKDISSDMHKKYGKIVGTYVFNIPMVFISGQEESREALLRDDFADRPDYFNLNIVRGKRLGILLTSGEHWKIQRRFTLQHLRQLGFGKSSLEWIVKEEIQAVFDGIEEISGGHKNGFPYPEEIDSHRETIDYDQPRDFIDIYLREIEKEKHGLHNAFNDLQLKVLCTELFMAGTDTTTNVLSFALLYLILYPEAQKKMQEEIDQVVGKDRLPSLDDRGRFTYVEAAIQEVLRLSSVSPSAFPHSAVTTDKYINFKGYHIPKGSVLLIDLYGVHHDPKIWKHPEMFIPERFLQMGEKNNQNASIFPFSTGKRGCPGETLARNNIFLFLTAILQRYTLKVPEGQPQPSQEPDGFTLLFPKPFTVKVQPRS